MKTARRRRGDPPAVVARSVEPDLSVSPPAHPRSLRLHLRPEPSYPAGSRPPPETPPGALIRLPTASEGSLGVPRRSRPSRRRLDRLRWNVIGPLLRRDALTPVPTFSRCATPWSRKTLFYPSKLQNLDGLVGFSGPPATWRHGPHGRRFLALRGEPHYAGTFLIDRGSQQSDHTARMRSDSGPLPQAPMVPAKNDGSSIGLRLFGPPLPPENATVISNITLFKGFPL
mgnify:CR=1 FL=1